MRFSESEAGLSVQDTAKDDGRRRVADGEIQPACVQSCPAQALAFGDRNDPDSTVSKMSQDPRNYKVLEDLNTSPSVVYLTRVEDDQQHD